MTTPSVFQTRHLTSMVAAVASVACVLSLHATLALGQAAAATPSSPDPRWQAWAGCWVPEPPASQPKALVSYGAESLPEVCVQPVAGTSAVDIETLVQHAVVNTRRINADGVRHQVTQAGCAGWESAEWNATGARVYLHSDVTCQGGPEQVASGVIAMTRTGDWIDVQGIATGSHTGVGVARYTMIDDSAMAQPSPTSARAVASARAARWVPEEGLTAADVVEASQHVGAPVIEGWLLQLDDGFALDARGLTDMARAHVAPELIDLVVALSYPERFAIDRATDQAMFRTTAEANTDAAYDGALAYDPYEYDPFFFDYGYSPYGFSPFGYGRYGRFYNGGYGAGSAPIVVVRSAPSNPGHVVNGRGYTQASAGSAGGGGSAQPGASAAQAPAPSSSSGAGAPAPAARTAIPRPPMH